MIKHSFIFLEKVGTKKEKLLWQQGIKDWHAFLNSKKINGVDSRKKYYYNRQIKQAQKALLNDDPAYFVGKLPAREMWRLYDHFREQCCYVDVEVNSSGKIVLVGISDYYNTHSFVFGVNLEKELLLKELMKYKIVVTFNGSSFDLPLLRKQCGIGIKIPHIDLKPLCVKLGLKGGLKEVEKMLNLRRPVHLYGNPIELWKAFYASGNREYLNLLIDYNREDVENLRLVMEHCNKRMRERIGSTLT